MKVQICEGKACRENFSEYIKIRLENDKNFFKQKNCEIESCLCLWQCKSGPNIILNGNIKNKMNPAKAAQIVFWK